MKGCITAIIACGLLAGSAFAQNGNPCPSAKSAQFNIIGVPKDKKPDMTTGGRIFVPLSGATKIYMTGDTAPATDGLQCGNSFYVTDANGTDGSATLVVPCTNVNSTSTDPGVCFDVFITALGKPFGGATVDVVCTFDATVIADIDAGSCATGTIDFPVSRGKGKPVQQDITNFMRASGCFDTNASGTCDSGEKTFSNIWIFNLEALLSYYWDYTNDGLRLSQVRFCESNSCGGFGVVP